MFAKTKHNILKITTLLGLLLFFFFGASQAQSVYINEFLSSNASVNTDEDGDYSDWIELYNPGSESVNLDGFGLSDNPTLPYKWVFPNIDIPAGSYLLVWCSDKNRINPSAPLHTNFKIGADGETLTLTDASGVTVDQIPPVALASDESYGRLPDASQNFVTFNQPTPGQPNIDEGTSQSLPEPEISQASGFYQDDFSVSILTTVEGASIIYTLDGSEPDENNLSGTTYSYKNQYPENPGDAFGDLLTNSFTTLSYSQPIAISDRTLSPNKVSVISGTYHFAPNYLPGFPVFKSTVVRARLVKPGYTPGKTVTRNYFVCPEGAAKFTLPVVSVTTSENGLFDYTNGIHVAGSDFDNWRTQNPAIDAQWSIGNYDRSGSSAEIAGNVSYLVNNTEVLNQDVGIRIHGGFTTRFPNKSLRLYARESLGANALNYPFFGSGNNDAFSTIILRNAGNDQSTTYFLDAFFHKSTSNLDFDTQAYSPAVAMLNGEYWGLLNFRERYDAGYFERVYGIQDNELDYLEISGVVEAKEGDTAHYDALYNYISTHSLQDQANYEYVITQLDPENFADYYITEIYASNTDWLSNNVELFRKRVTYSANAAAGVDGRWRWMLKDVDVSLGLATPVTHNTLAFATDPAGTGQNTEWATRMFRSMLDNDVFRDYFITRFADLLNITFLPNRMSGIFTQMQLVLAPEMQKHIDRWVAMGSYQSWLNYCSAINSFILQRDVFQRDHIREKFGIDSNVNVSLDVWDDGMGFVKINTIEIKNTTDGVAENPYPWTGIYFKNKSITVTAIANPGYQFSHWSGDSTSTDAQITLTPTGDIHLTAHFIPATENPEIPISFWMADTSVPNDTPFQTVNSSYEIASEGTLEFQSCLPGYPYTSSDPLWRTASLERVNSPTEINYLPEANNDVAFADANMRGLQVRPPYEYEGVKTTLIFHQSTQAYQDIRMRFAARDDNAVSGIEVAYADGDNWITTGLPQTQFPLTSEYSLIDIDFSGIAAATNNPTFKVRIQFYGDNLDAFSNGKFIFNNLSFSGKTYLGVIRNETHSLQAFPNPVSGILTIGPNRNNLEYQIFSVQGQLITSGKTSNGQIDCGSLAQGIYLLRVASGDKSQIIRIVKK